MIRSKITFLLFIECFLMLLNTSILRDLLLKGQPNCFSFLAGIDWIVFFHPKSIMLLIKIVWKYLISFILNYYIYWQAIFWNILNLHFGQHFFLLPVQHSFPSPTGMGYSGYSLQPEGQLPVQNGAVPNHLHLSIEGIYRNESFRKNLVSFATDYY